MAGTHNFKTFDLANSNMTTDANYDTDDARLNGVSAGKADPLSFNKAVHQATIMTAAIAQVAANNGQSFDDTNLANLVTALTNILTTPSNASYADRIAHALQNKADIGNISICGRQDTPIAATYTATGTGNLLGGYHYREVFITGYVNPDGTHYVRGFAPAAQRSAYDVSLSSQQVAITNIPIGGAGCIGRAIYRSAANGDAGTEKFCTVIWDNTTTSYTDNKVDSQLGTGMPDVEGTAIPADVPTANTTGTYSNSFVTTLSCSKSGTVFQLTGLNATSGKVACIFGAPATYTAGDTFTIDGTAYTIYTTGGEALRTGAFHSGDMVFVMLDINGHRMYFYQAEMPTAEQVGAVKAISKTFPEIPDENNPDDYVWLPYKISDTNFCGVACDASGSLLIVTQKGDGTFNKFRFLTGNGDLLINDRSVKNASTADSATASSTAHYASGSIALTTAGLRNVQISTAQASSFLGAGNINMVIE